METRLIGKIVSRRFRIEEVIGRGGMSIVYRAFDLKTHQTVAVKVLREEYEDDKEYRDRFEREADVCKRLNHPNIVNLIASGTAGGISYIAMEYVDGMTLKEIIDERKVLPQEDAVHYALQILAALQQAHQRGIVHRDIKPQNMMVTRTGQLKVTDFGIAGIADSDTLTNDGSVIGSVHYFSPEQAKGMKATSASDLYSVGIILYEMLTGHVPFNGESAVAIAMMHLMQEPKPVEDQVKVSPAIANIVHRSLSKSVKLRYQTALEMSSDLRRALRHPDGRFLKPVNLEPPKRPQLLPLLIVIIAALLVAIGVSGHQLYKSMFVITTAPSVVGKTREQAVEEVVNAGLVAEIDKEYSDTVEVGKVIRQFPDPEVQMERGNTVQLLVSLGREYVSVPRFIGYSLNEAIDIAVAQGFRVMDTEVVPSGIMKEQVIGQNPEPGTETSPGADVFLSISGGRVIVPDFTGVWEEDAKNRIKEVGLTVGEVTLKTVENARQNNIVLSQTLEPFEEVLPGSIIDLSVGYYEQRIYTFSKVISLSEVDQGTIVRVMLVEPDGIEYEMYNEKKEADSIEVMLRSESSGLKKCRLYLNGNFMYEENVVLTKEEENDARMD